MTVKTRRKQYSIVDRSLQYRVLAIILIYSLVIVLFLAVCLFIPDILAMANQDLSLEMRAAAADRLLTLHSRVKIRKSDYLHREEEALNQMIEGLSERCESLQQAGLRALGSFSAIEQTPSQISGGQDSDQQLLQEHRQHLADLLEQVHRFRLSDEDKVEQETG